MKTIPTVTPAQLAALQQAAARATRALEPLPAKINGAARQSVLNSLVVHGYATKCYFPGHVEYSITDLGLKIGLGNHTDTART